MSQININQSTNQSASAKTYKKKANLDVMKSSPVGFQKNYVRKSHSLGICMICLSENASGKLFDCNHQVLCAECAQQHVLISIQKQQIPTCLLLFCKAPLSTQSQLFNNFSPSTKAKWNAFHKRSSIVIKNKHLSIKQCRKPDCPGSVDPDTQCCQICEQQHCQKCNRQIHQGQCIGKTFFPPELGIKACNFCDQRLYKKGGCPRIFCNGCKRYICYECLQQWSVSHHGCAEYGWFQFLSNYFSQCCSSNTVDTKSQIHI